MHVTRYTALPAAPSPPQTSLPYAETPSATFLAPTAFSLSTTPTPLKASRHALASTYADFYVIPAPDSPVSPLTPVATPTEKKDIRIIPAPPRSTSPDFTRFKKPKFSARLQKQWMEKEREWKRRVWELEANGKEFVEVRLTARELEEGGMQVMQIEGELRELSLWERMRRVDKNIWVLIMALGAAGSMAVLVAVLVMVWGL